MTSVTEIAIRRHRRMTAWRAGCRETCPSGSEGGCVVSSFRDAASLPYAVGADEAYRILVQSQYNEFHAFVTATGATIHHGGDRAFI